MFCLLLRQPFWAPQWAVYSRLIVPSHTSQSSFRPWGTDQFTCMYMMRSTFSLPKLFYLLRTSPCFLLSHFMEFDEQKKQYHQMTTVRNGPKPPFQSDLGGWVSEVLPCLHPVPSCWHVHPSPALEVQNTRKHICHVLL